MPAFTVTYRRGLSAEPNTRVAYAIRSIKTELRYNGFGNQYMDLDVPTMGKHVDAAIREFQSAHDLVVDGVMGPRSMLVLTRKRKLEVQGLYKIPYNYLAKLATHESLNDPAAYYENVQDGSVWSTDRGYFMVNDRFHPSVTWEQCAHLGASAQFAGRYLSNAKAEIQRGLTGTGLIASWLDAVTSYNLGVGGTIKWIKAGRPMKNADGSPTIAAKYRQAVTGAAY